MIIIIIIIIFFSSSQVCCLVQEKCCPCFEHQIICDNCQRAEKVATNERQKQANSYKKVVCN